MIRRLLARFHAWTAPPASTRRTPPPMRGPGDLPMLRLVVTPNPVPGGPADLLLVRGTDAFLVSYGELELVFTAAANLRDALARFSPHYQPAEVPPSVETLH